MKVEIITIGDELLIGQVVDTNSAWMGRILNDIGFEIVHKTVVGDDADAIIAAINAAKNRVSLVLMTGGLGPTKDDITMRTLCRFFNCGLRFSEEVHANIERIFSRNGRSMNELTHMQAMVPDKCTVIQNQAGTAPCTWFEQDGLTLISMPGVPSEMKWLMTNEIVPRLTKRFRQDLYILHRSFWVIGFTESALAIRLTEFEDQLPPEVKLAYLPQSGIIRLRLSTYCKQEEEALHAINTQQKRLQDALGEHILAEDERNISEIVGDRLREKGWKVGTAESCTGGAIAALLTATSGSSDYYVGSIVAYSNLVKQNVLGVSATDLQQHGAVSREVVEQMAKGALKVLGCDCAIATSGIAGPNGGTPEKPVGTVWIAVANKDTVISECCMFGIVREQNIQRAVHTGLLMLMEMIGGSAINRHR